MDIHSDEALTSAFEQAASMKPPVHSDNSGGTILNFGASYFSFESPLCQVSAYGVFSQGHFQAEL